MNMLGGLFSGGGAGGIGDLLGGLMGGGTGDEEEEEEEEEDFMKIPRKKKYKNRPVSMAPQNAGIDMNDLARMFGGGGGQADEEIPNMGFGLNNVDAGASDQGDCAARGP